VDMLNKKEARFTLTSFLFLLPNCCHNEIKQQRITNRIR
jgi:hypothetical protein